MKNLKRPTFLTFIAGALLLFCGLGLNASGYETGTYLLYAGVGLVGIFWIWSVFVLLGANDLKPFQKRFWMIAVIAVPVLGALVFHVLHQKRNRLTT